MTTRRQFLKKSAATVAAGSLLPYASRAPAAIKNGGTLTVALTADPRTFDPHLAGSLQGRATTQAIHDTLFELDASGKLAPGLVESWEWKDDRTVVLTTRQGVKFHHGREVVASDVRYSLSRLALTKSKRFNVIQPILGAEAAKLASVAARMSSRLTSGAVSRI